MNRHRLAVLLHHLRHNVKDDKFSLDEWVLFDLKVGYDISCGSMGCALGHATTIPEFQEAGLHMDSSDYTPIFNDERGFDAAASFFGLTDSQSFHLFHPDAYPSKASRHDVLSRIIMLLAESKKRNHDRY